MLPAMSLLKIGEVARRCEVSVDTLRHYERLGLLPEVTRTASNYRLYREETVARVLLVRRALALGFTLSELRDLLRSRDSGRAPCTTACAMLAGKLALLEERLLLLTALRDELRSTLTSWQEQLAQTPPGQAAHLLEKLDASLPTAPKGFQQ